MSRPPGDDAVSVTTAARLHFGMFSFGHEQIRRFGGVGAMVSPPAVQVRLRRSEMLHATGPQAERAGEIARRVLHALDASDVGCELRVEHALTPHVGLGSGTQLALAVAAGVHTLLERPIPPASQLSILAGRGRRSAIGTYGFERGGLLMEVGKLAADELSPLVDRCELPEVWRFVLASPRSEAGLSGSDERRAFDRLPAVPANITDRLCRIATWQLLPAARSGDFAAFSAALGEFNRVAGECFAAVQGGAFNGPAVTRLVESLQQLGVTGVGQSSWGPTVFALVENDEHARELADRLRAMFDDELTINVAVPENRGARIEVNTLQR